jgi:hypothetical protein
MAKNGIDDRTASTPPRLKRETVKNPDGTPKVENGKKVRQTVDTDNGNQPFDKNKTSEHHAEQRMERSAAQNDETVLAQSPSQPCCAGCQKALGQPDPKTGVRPIDKIPSDRQGLDQ